MNRCLHCLADISDSRFEICSDCHSDQDIVVDYIVGKYEPGEEQKAVGANATKLNPEDWQ